MSFGKSQSSQQSQSQQQSQSSLNPQIMADLQGNYNNVTQNFPKYSPYSGTTVADFNPTQTGAFGLIGDIGANQTGAAAVNQAVNTTGGLTGYQPTTITPMSVTGAQIAPGSVGSVTPSLVGNMDLSKYENPYQSQVVDTTTAAAQNALQQQENQNASDATRAGAWRGNALAVQNGIAQGQSNIGLDQTIAQLEQQGYTNAQATATADANRQLTADQGNQATQLAAGTTNAGLAQQAALANQTTGLAAQTSNQNASLQGGQLQLAAGAQLAAEGGQQLNDAITRANAVLASGNQQQAQQAAQLQWAYQNNYLNAQQYAFNLQQLTNQTLGLAGNPTTTTASGSSSGSGSSNSFSLTLPTPVPS